MSQFDEELDDKPAGRDQYLPGNRSRNGAGIITYNPENRLYPDWLAIYTLSGSTRKNRKKVKAK